MKRMIGLITLLALVSIFAGCSPGDQSNNSASKVSSQVSSKAEESSNNTAASQQQSTSTTQNNSNTGTTNTDAVIDQLNELNQVLDGLDEVTEDGMDIPTP